jgi:hypothetical protein
MVHHFQRPSDSNLSLSFLALLIFAVSVRINYIENHSGSGISSQRMSVASWRRQVPPKRRFLQEPHSVTTQKTQFFFHAYFNFSASLV